MSEIEVTISFKEGTDVAHITKAVRAQLTDSPYPPDPSPELQRDYAIVNAAVDYVHSIGTSDEDKCQGYLIACVEGPWPEPDMSNQDSPVPS